MLIQYKMAIHSNAEDSVMVDYMGHDRDRYDRHGTCQLHQFIPRVWR